MPRRSRAKDKWETPQERIDLFLKRAEEMRGKRALQRGLNLSYKMKTNFLTGDTTTEFKEPDHEELISYLTVFRKFISDKEPVHANGIYNICKRYLLDSEIRNRVSREYDIWKELQGYAQEGTVIVIDGKKQKTIDVVRLWINAELFHDDKAGFLTLDGLHELNRAASKFVYLNYVIVATKLIGSLASAIRSAKEQSLFKFDY